MVIPVSGEVDWVPVLRGLPEWQPRAQPIIVISPHPDDETLALGGFIACQRAAGIPVTLVAVTDGENAYAEERNLGEVRATEQGAAVKRLGVDESSIVRLRLPDSRVDAHQEQLFEALLPMVTADSQLMAPWVHDFHPDHEACGRVAARLAQRTGASLTSYFFWTWHRGRPDAVSVLELRRYPLTREIARVKSDALTCHASQLRHASGEPILPENLLWPARLPFEVFLPDEA